MPLYLRRMRRHDIPQVMRIEREAFPTEWPPTNFNREMENKLAYYIVASTEPPPVVAKTFSLSWLQKIKQLAGSASGRLAVSGTTPADDIIGYAGMWMLADEAHITSLATPGQRRRQGIGESLLQYLIELATRKQARVATLEARVSNIPAQNLYLKYGFEKQGVRRNYYLDNHEDAVVMTTGFLHEDAFRIKLAALQQAHLARCGSIDYDYSGFFERV